MRHNQFSPFERYLFDKKVKIEMILPSNRVSMCQIIIVIDF